MKIYHLKRVQVLSISLSEAWLFFSSPKNLSGITPPGMDFKILHISGGEKAYAGQIICYKIKALGAQLNWVTEITHVKELSYFIDEQRLGPYTLWHHQHHFKEVSGGVEMTDEVSYALPFGILGRLVHRIFVEGAVKGIFDFRFKALEKLFGNKKAP